MQPNSLDLSLKPLVDTTFTKNIHDLTLKNFRKITPNFYEALGFRILESKIFSYDANDFMNFIENYKNEVSEFQLRSENYIRIITHGELQLMFDSMREFLENMNCMLLDESMMDREQAIQLMVQTFEDYGNNLLKALGFYMKAKVVNYAEKKKPVYAFSLDPYRKYTEHSFFEKERNFAEIEGDLNLIKDSHIINVSLFSDDFFKDYNLINAFKKFYFMYSDKTYLILYQNEVNGKTAFVSPPRLFPEIPPAIGPETDPNNKMLNVQVVSYENIDPSLCCCTCKQIINEKAFVNAICGHKFCYYCLIEKTQSNSCSSICFEARCIEHINLKELEDFLIQMQMQKEIEDNPNVKFNSIAFSCSKCQNQEEVRVSEIFGMPEYFICSKCKDMQCCAHSLSVEECQCFCLKCKNRFEFFQKVQENYCKTCEKKYCTICKLEKSECKCYCPLCYNKKKSKRCETCAKQCFKCQIFYEKSFLVLAECGNHLICRCCMIKEVNFGKFDGVLKFCPFCERKSQDLLSS